MFRSIHGVWGTVGTVAAVRYNNWKKTWGDKKDFVGWLFKVLDHDLTVLLNHPLTFHDVIIFMAQAQWYVLDIMAFLNYVLYVIPHIDYPPSTPPLVSSDWMGCFTADSKVCDRLFYVGVPVWLVWNNFTITPRTITKKSVKYTFPNDIIHSTHSEGGKPTHSFDCLYCSPGSLLCPYSPPLHSYD